MLRVFINNTSQQLEEVYCVPQAFSRLVGTPQSGKWLFSAGNSCQLLFCQLLNKDIEVWKRYFIAKEPCIIRFANKGPYLGMHMALYNQLNYIIGGHGQMEMNEHQFNFIYIPDGEVQLHLFASGQYSLFEVCSYKELSWCFNISNSTINTFGNPAPTPFVLYPEARNPGITLQHLLYEISSVTGKGEEDQALLNFSSMELFYHLCADLYKKQMLTKVPEHAIVQKIEDARKFIEDNFSIHFTIPQLALKSGINTTSFKQYFIQVTGMQPNPR